MTLRIGTLAVLVALLACAPAWASPVAVTLRVEGAHQTLFEGRVTTDGHLIEKDRSGPRPCDGTNSHANPTPGPTMTSALDSALAWNGTWSNSLQDFSINGIGPDENNLAAGRFWGYALNYKAASAGGCQTRVVAGDQVLFAYDFFNKKHYLKLTGPASVIAGRRFRVKVVDGQTGKPISGASIGKLKTNGAGIAALIARGSGTLLLKASRSDSVRSNGLRVKIRGAKKASHRHG